MANAKYDIDLAKRFRLFRKKYISNSQYEAADELLVTQKHVSAMETGMSSIGIEILQILVRKFDMDANWFFTGTGKHKRSEKDNRKLIHDIGDLQADIDLMFAALKDQQGQIRLIASAVKKEIKESKRLG